MGAFIAEQIAQRLEAPAGPVLVLGITFKENVPDVRNAQVPGMAAALAARGIETHVHDPFADAGEVESRYGIRLLPRLDGAGPYACVLGAVAHAPYQRVHDGDLRLPARAGRPCRGHQEHVARHGAARRAQALDPVSARHDGRS